MSPVGSDLLVSEPDEVVTITLNRPERKNALSIELRDEITAALGELAGDERVKVVVVTGAGDVFCAGFDLREFGVEDPEFQRRLWESSDAFHQAWIRFPLPTVAAVNGAALGGGFDLAVMCDVRVAAHSARFAHPEHTFSDVVFGPLHDLVGGSAARDLALTGREIDAAEALRIGLVSRQVPNDELAAAAAETATQIASAPRDVLVRMKAKIISRAGVAAGPTLDL